LIDSTDHQQNSRREETKKHHRPQNRLSVCLSLEKRARGGGGEGKRGGGWSSAPTDLLEFYKGEDQQTKTPENLFRFLSGKEGIEEDWRIW
jgi:hypothetical protein